MLSSLHNRIRTTPWLGRTALKVIPDLEWRIDVKPIGKVTIRLRQHRMFWLRPPLTFEGFMLGVLQRLVHKGDIVYDIGANIGLYSRFITQVFGASHVYAFEPMKNNCILLSKNLKLADCTSQVSVMPYAIGNENGTTEFQIDDLTSNSGTLDVVTGGKPSQSRAQYGLAPATVSVQVRRLDTLIETEGLPKPDVIKLDIEGAEAMALEGATQLLAEQRPRLLIELHGAEVARQVVQCLWRNSYHCFGPLIQDGKTTYGEITPDHLPYITGKYSLHYVIASHDPSDLMPPFEDFVAEK